MKNLLIYSMLSFRNYFDPTTLRLEFGLANAERRFDSNKNAQSLYKRDMASDVTDTDMSPWAQTFESFEPKLFACSSCPPKFERSIIKPPANLSRTVHRFNMEDRLALESDIDSQDMKTTMYRPSSFQRLKVPQN
jgi:hypothetical protein